jgi:hypothetical protein
LSISVNTVFSVNTLPARLELSALQLRLQQANNEANQAQRKVQALQEQSLQAQRVANQSQKKLSSIQAEVNLSSTESTQNDISTKGRFINISV